MILNALAGKPLPVYGEGDNVRDWLFVDDHARALRLVLEKGVPGETYNIGGHNERTEPRGRPGRSAGCSTSCGPTRRTPRTRS